MHRFVHRRFSCTPWLRMMATSAMTPRLARRSTASHSALQRRWYAANDASVVTPGALSSTSCETQAETAQAPAWLPLLSFNNLGDSTAATATAVSAAPWAAPPSALDNDWADAVCSWWTSSYGAGLFRKDCGGAEPHDNAGNSDNKDSCISDEGSLPYESAEVAVLTQAVAVTLLRLQHAIASRKEVNEDGCHGWCTVAHEVEALLVYLIRTRLRYFSLARETKARQPPGAERADADSSLTDENTDGEHRVVPVDTVTEEANALFLRRGARERVRDLVVPYTATELLQVVVLVETIQAVLQVADFIEHREGLRTPVLSHTTKSVLYTLAVKALGAVEQLPAAMLAGLATCMAQCADSHAVSLQLALHRAGIDSNGVGETSVDDGVSPDFFLRRPTESPELVEARRVEQQLLGGDVSATARPTEVLGHFSVLTTEAQKRMDAALATVSAESTNDDDDDDVDDFEEFWQACSHEPSNITKKDKKMVRAAASAARLGLRSLAEKKAAERRGQSMQRRKQLQGSQTRKTLGRLTAPTEHDECEAAPEEESLVLSLTDVAELCTATASLHLVSDERYWRTITRFACFSAHHFTREPRAAGEDGERTATLNEAAFLNAMRDIAFALDYVQHHKDYDTLMAALVRLSVLQAPIPPPSAPLKKMKARRDG